MLLLEGGQTVNGLRRSLLRDARAWLGLGSRFERAVLVEDLLLAAIDASLSLQQLPRDKTAFDAELARCRSRLGTEASRLELLVARIAAELHASNLNRGVLDKTAFVATRADVEAQLQGLFRTGFLTATPRIWLERYPVYLKAIAVRQDKLSLRLPRDLECVAEMQLLQRRMDEYLRVRGGVPGQQAVQEYRWLLEEYRVSLFAQQLGTLQPVSRKRLDKIWEVILAEQRGR